jgi:hypothetical protein
VMKPKRHETRIDPTINYSIVREARDLAGWSKECEALSIYHELSKLEVSRGKRGKRYTLALLLTCVLLAKMAGETTLQAIADWIRLRSNWLQDVLPETRATFPCAATYSNVLRTVDSQRLGTSCARGSQFLCACAFRFVPGPQCQTADAILGCSPTASRSPPAHIFGGTLNGPARYGMRRVEKYTRNDTSRLNRCVSDVSLDVTPFPSLRLEQ